MDPQATLQQALAALHAGEYQAALDRLVDYATWRYGGGFEPKHVDGTINGDFYAASILFRLCGVARQ